jgi:hypothetical protein
MLTTRRITRDVRIALIYSACVFTLLLGLTVSNVTYSSIGILSESGAVDVSVVHGQPRAIRSDEFLRGNPLNIGGIQNNGQPGALTPFDAASTTRPESLAGAALRYINDLAHPENLILRFVIDRAPVDAQFAWSLWYSSFLLLIGLPFFLRLVGLDWSIAIIGAWLTWLSAANQWWSLTAGSPVESAAICAVLLLGGLRIIQSPNNSLARWVVGVLLALAAGIRITEVVGGYPPWTIPTFLVFTSVTLAAIFASTAARRSKWTLVIASVGASALSSLLFLYVSREKYLTMAATVYPGARRSVGASESPIWSGSVVWSLQDQVPGLIAGNQSELAIGLVIALLTAGFAIATVASRANFARIPALLPAVAGATSLTVIVLWAAAPWPSLLLRGNPLALVPGQRALQIAGVLAIIVYAIALQLAPEIHRNSARKRVMWLTGFVVMFLSAQSGFAFKNGFLPTLSDEKVWISAIIIGVALTLPFVMRNRLVALIPLILFSIFTVYNVNPWQEGTGSLTHSATARLVQEAASVDGGRWASDNIFTDALILASGVPQLSGQQTAGPNNETWRVLDPMETQVNAWNRGSSFVEFNWGDNEIATITNPSPDQILITISPCATAMQKLNLEWVLTSQILRQPCVRYYGQGSWHGSPVNLYRVT